jgi:hypothetical protein
MLMELERRGCRPSAEALGQTAAPAAAPSSRGSWGHDLARGRLAAWAAGELAHIRRKIEEDFQGARGHAGLDRGRSEFRSRGGWQAA